MSLYNEVTQWLDRFETLSGEPHPLRKSLPALFDAIVGAKFDWNGAAPAEREGVSPTALDQLKSFSYNLLGAGVATTQVVYPSTPQTLTELRSILDDTREFMLTLTVAPPRDDADWAAPSGRDEKAQQEQLRAYILTLINHLGTATQQLEHGARIDLPTLVSELITALERFRDQEWTDQEHRATVTGFITRLSPWAGVIGAALQGLSVVLQITQ
jgi:hypothetical protein